MNSSLLRNVGFQSCRISLASDCAVISTIKHIYNIRIILPKAVIFPLSYIYTVGNSRRFSSLLCFSLITYRCCSLKRKCLLPYFIIRFVFSFLLPVCATVLPDFKVMLKLMTISNRFWQWKNTLSSEIIIKCFIESVVFKDLESQNS